MKFTYGSKIIYPEFELIPRTSFYYLDGTGKDITDTVLLHAKDLGTACYFSHSIFHYINQFSKLYPGETFITEMSINKGCLYLTYDGWTMDRVYVPDTKRTN